MISGSLCFAHFLLVVGNELFNRYIFVGRFYLTIAHWAALRLCHPLFNAFLAVSMHAGNQSCRDCHLFSANDAHELLGNTWINYHRGLLFVTVIHVLQKFLKISDLFIDFIKLFVLILCLRSYEILFFLLLICFYNVRLSHLFQDLLGLFGVPSDSRMLKGTLVAVTPEGMLALNTNPSLDFVDYLSLLEDCFLWFLFGLRLRLGLRLWSGNWNWRWHDYDNRSWVYKLAALFVAFRTELALLSGGLRRRRMNNRSWWLVV